MFTQGPAFDGRPRIVIIDNDSAVRQQLVRVIDSAGFATCGVADGEAALALVAATSPDVVVLDVGEPKAPGWKTLKALRAREPRLPVVALTAEPNQQAAAASAGAVALFEKPLDLAALLRSLALAARNRQNPSLT